MAAGAATVTCPTVSATGVVTPAPAPGVDWFDCDLGSANLAGADLAGADLYYATLTGANLSGANLTGADLIETDLASANLTNANLAGANLTETYLAGANLDLVTSGSVTASVAPRLPANWTLKGGYLLGPDADLADANLSGFDLSGTDLNGANLAGANVNGAQLAGADVIGTRFGAINGTPASLPTGYVIVTVPAGKATPGNYLAGPEAYLHEVDFSGRDLSNTDLSGADLSGADLSGADLSGASLARWMIPGGLVTFSGRRR